MQTMKKLFLILSVAAGLVSCEDFLTAGDPNKIDAPSYFRNESDLEAYANGFLQTMIPTAISVATGDARADYMAWRGEWQYLTDNFDADDQSGWSTGSWEDLRNINYFLGNFRRAAAGEAILDHYEGVARFWRAYFYMNKVKTFGAVPWYDREIDANDREALYKPRDSREYVMRKVLEDLDFASTHCITNAKLEVNSVRITRNVALAFKARCCLYEGTFRKYHANDPSTGKPWTADESEMYLRACADACETLMGEGKYALVSDPAKVATQYRSLFTSESVASGEVIWARAYDASLNATHILNTYFVNMQYGSYSLTRQFVNTYLNRDGSRFTDKAGYEKTLFADEFENRDYRLMQSIRYPGYTRRNNNVNTPYAPDFGYCVTGYQPIKWGSSTTPRWTAIRLPAPPASRSCAMPRCCSTTPRPRPNWANSARRSGTPRSNSCANAPGWTARCLRPTIPTWPNTFSTPRPTWPSWRSAANAASSCCSKTAVGTTTCAGVWGGCWNARGMASMWASWARSTTWTATVRATSASCAKIPR